MISIEFYNSRYYKKRRPLIDTKNTSASKMLITTINKMHKIYIWEPIRDLAVISVFISNVFIPFKKNRINITNYAKIDRTFYLYNKFGDYHYGKEF
tara:strand:+ start:2377 stop:2664 length:288 start_codon:yes stop_codon:yes gene_type:complete